MAPPQCLRHLPRLRNKCRHAMHRLGRRSLLGFRGRLGHDLGRGLIRLQRIYNFDCSMLLYYHSWLSYIHFIATLYHFLGLTY